jgi:4,5-DOPA dioxygenase extradiol
VVHNLGLMDGARPESGFAWAERFDEATRAQVVEAPEDVLALAEHQDYALAVPTPDHFLPLIYFAAAAAEAGATPSVVLDGYAYGSLSMTCYRAG